MGFTRQAYNILIVISQKMFLHIFGSAAKNLLNLQSHPVEFVYPFIENLIHLRNCFLEAIESEMDTSSALHIAVLIASIIHQVGLYIFYQNLMFHSVGLHFVLQMIRQIVFVELYQALDKCFLLFWVDALFVEIIFKVVNSRLLHEFIEAVYFLLHHGFTDLAMAKNNHFFFFVIFSRCLDRKDYFLFLIILVLPAGMIVLKFRANDFHLLRIDRNIIQDAVDDKLIEQLSHQFFERSGIDSLKQEDRGESNFGRVVLADDVVDLRKTSFDPSRIVLDLNEFQDPAGGRFQAEYHFSILLIQFILNFLLIDSHRKSLIIIVRRLAKINLQSSAPFALSFVRFNQHNKKYSCDVFGRREEMVFY